MTAIDGDRPIASMTGAVAEFVAGAATTDFSEELRDLATRHVLDTLAAIVVCRDLEPSIVARRYAATNSGGGRSTILGTTERASLLDAVFASAMTGHGAEINDFMPSVFVQPGPAIVSTALGIAEQRGSTGDALVRSILVGYELAARIPRSVGVDNLRRGGVATHGIAPVFGAATAGAVLADLPEDRIGDLLSCCVQQASGSWQWLLDVEHIEKSLVFAGMGARNGLHAVLLVEAGFRGVRECLDVAGGWRAGFDRGDADGRALLDFSDLTAMHDTAYKRYPVGGPTQPAISALLELVEVVDAGEIDRVLIEMPGRAAAFRDAEMPALNLRYLTALILSDGRLDFVATQSLERMHTDSAIGSWMDRVEVVHDPAQETGTGRDRAESARVTITLVDGTVHERFVPFVRGFPSHPMSRDDVETKARELLAPHLGDERTATIVDRCRRLGELERADELIGLIAR